MSAIESVASGVAFVPFAVSDTDCCPTCDQLIPPERVAAVKGRLVAHDRDLTTALSAQFERARRDDQTQARNQLDQAREEGRRALQDEQTRSAEALGQARADADARETRTRQEASAAYEQRLQEQLAAVNSTHTAELQARDANLAEVDTRHSQQLADVAREQELREEELNEKVQQIEIERDRHRNAVLEKTAEIERIRIESAQATHTAVEALRAELTQQHSEQLEAELVPLRNQITATERELNGKLHHAEQERDRQKVALSEKTAELERARTESAKATQAAVEVERAALTQQHAEHLEATITPLRLQIQRGEEATAEAVAAALAEHRQREAATTEQLSQVNAKLLETENAKHIAEEQLRNADALKTVELAQQREILEAAGKAAVLAEQSKRFEETQKWSADLDDMRRKLEKKTADELGEGAEIVLYEELREAFPDDRITEVKRGQPGADIIHEVRINGSTVGKLIYDSKNRKDWKTEYATKLRTDQLAEHAEHAVLSSNKFPANTKQLHIVDHVIIACPARVIALATILREHVITMHTLRVSSEAREDKTLKLYDFISSARFTQLLEAVNTHVGHLEQIDVEERRKHDAVWTKRGKTIKAIAKSNADLRFEVSQIIGVLTEADAEAQDATE